MISISSSNDYSAKTAGNARPSASNWLWRPWYAKLWWFAIPIWWAGMGGASVIEPLSRFYDSAAAGFLNVLFFPMTALMVLGVGYAQSWLAAVRPQSGGYPRFDAASAAADELWEQHEGGIEDLHASTDILDPRSGPLWIGNPLSSQWPNRRL